MLKGTISLSFHKYLLNETEVEIFKNIIKFGMNFQKFTFEKPFHYSHYRHNLHGNGRTTYFFFFFG